ncbi:MAG: hypothetical protein AB1742_05775 [bacterium]
MKQGLISNELKLSDPLIRDILRMNPWWEGKPLPVLPSTRRHLAAGIRSPFPHLTTIAGHIAESVAGVSLLNVPGLDISWFPERPHEPEIDFILTVGTKHVPLEVRYQARIDPLRDTEGLRTFIEKKENNAPFGVLVTQTDGAPVYDPRIVTIPLSSLMLMR